MALAQMTSLQARISAPAVRVRSSRASRLVVRAQDSNPLKEVTDKLDNEVGPKAREAVVKTTGRTVEETAPESQSTEFGEQMAFSGFIPERANSRLAMIGVLAALAAELNGGPGVLQQIQAATLQIAGVFVLFITASAIPTAKGVTPEKAQGGLGGIWSSRAEVYNGRLAMIGFFGLIVAEAIKGGPLLSF